ncbi:MAG: GNAT family N-acetyltransferase [Pseudomonadota bacterium]
MPLERAPPETFTTAGLTLRRPRLEDAGAVFRNYATDPQVVRYLCWRLHESEADTLEFLQFCERAWQEEIAFTYAIEPLADSTGPIGMIDMRFERGQVHFGYVLGRLFWGQGIMSEALTCLVDWSLAQASIWRAAAYCDVENLGSARVMEKAGMVREGLLRRYAVHSNVSPDPRDCYLYAKVR